MYQDAATAGPPPPAFRPWAPQELGAFKSAVLAVLLVAAILAFCLYASGVLAPPPPPPAIQVTQAQLVQLPAPTPPPPPPKVVPPPKPLPAIIPKPVPVPSKIVVATKPPPPVVRHVIKPVPHPVVTHTPPPPVPQKQPAPPQPAAPPTSGIPVYGAQMHAILQANQNVPAALAQLGISGTAYVEIVVAPDGHAISAKIYRTSGNSLIDQTALQHALAANYGAFNAQMPGTSLAFVVPIEIQPQDQ